MVPGDCVAELPNYGENVGGAGKEVSILVTE